MSRCGVRRRSRCPAERWGVVIGTCNAGLLAGEEWYCEAQARRAARPAAPAARRAAGVLRGPRERLRAQGARALGRHRLRRERERDRLRRRADPGGPCRRHAHRRRRRLLGHPLRRLQLARVALAEAGRALLVRPQGPVARRGRGHARAHGRGGGCASTARPCSPRSSATACPPTATTRRRRTPRAGARRARSRRRSARPASTRARSTTSTATARARPRTTRRRRRRPRSASATPPTRSRCRARSR